jgi:hypothetical protein
MVFGGRFESAGKALGGMALALTALAIGALLVRAPSVVRWPAMVFGALLGTLLVNTVLWSYLAPWQAVVIGVSPLAALIVDAGPLRRIAGWKRVALRLAAVGAVLGPVTLMTPWREYLAPAESGYEGY